MELFFMSNITLRVRPNTVQPQLNEFIINESSLIAFQNINAAYEFGTYLFISALDFYF